MAALLAIGAILAGWTFWRAGHVLGEARVKVEQQQIIHFTSHPLQPAVSAGIESIGAPAVFADAQVFGGRLFIASPAGLAEYDNDGGLVARYRPGIELPAAPLAAMAVGVAGDSRVPELWIATGGEGLVAFDGRRFRQIRAEEPRFRKITALVPLATGRIAMGTEKAGVLVWDGSNIKPFHSSLSDVPVTALAGDDTNLWVGTLERGLFHWKAGAVGQIDLPEVLSLAIDGETTYAGTGSGVAEIRDGKIVATLAQGRLAQSLLVSDGHLYVGTLEEGTLDVPLDMDPGRAPVSARARGCQDCSIRRILKIDGAIYSLAEDSLWRDASAVLSRDPQTLTDRNVSALSVDAQGRLWVGYFDRGLDILPPDLTRGRHLEDDHLYCINRIAQDAARGLSAVATANGLVVLFDDSGAHRRVLGHADGLIADQVTDVLFRTDGSIAAATPAGVSFIDGSGISSLYAFEGLVNNHVYALAADGQRTLAGTLGGISILDRGLVTASYTTANSGLKHNWITAFARARGDWFVGTYGAGVVRMDSAGRFETFDDLRAPLEINEGAMLSTDRAVYAGTLDHGLAIYSLASGRWGFFTAGLPSLNVTALVSSGGMLFIGTDNGLVKVPESAVLR